MENFTKRLRFLSPRPPPAPPPSIAGFAVKIIVMILFAFNVCVHRVGWLLKFKANLDSRL